MVRYDTLLQNATDNNAKNNSYFITKRGRNLLKNASGILLKNETVLLQFSTVITNYINFITKYSSYYKWYLLLQNASVKYITNISLKTYLRKDVKKLISMITIPECKSLFWFFMDQSFYSSYLQLSFDTIKKGSLLSKNFPNFCSILNIPDRS